jgi:hypothetical protein
MAAIPVLFCNLENEQARLRGPPHEADLRATRAFAQDLHRLAIYATRRLRSRTCGVLKVAGFAVEVQDRAGRRCPAIGGQGVRREHFSAGMGLDSKRDDPSNSSRGGAGHVQFPHAEGIPGRGSDGKQDEHHGSHVATVPSESRDNKFLAVVKAFYTLARD